MDGQMNKECHRYVRKGEKRKKTEENMRKWKKEFLAKLDHKDKEQGTYCSVLNLLPSISNFLSRPQEFVSQVSFSSSFKWKYLILTVQHSKSTNERTSLTIFKNTCPQIFLPTII